MTGEEEYKNILGEIDELKSMLSGGMFSSDKPDWKSVWQQIRLINSGFKGIRFPTHDEHENAWNHFQSLVAQAKEKQGEVHQEWENTKRESSHHKDEIIEQAEMAKPSGPGSDLILSLATGGLSTALSALMGPFDERKQELLACNEHLKKGWGLLKEYKEKMLGRDKNEAFNALNTAKEQLDYAWDEYSKNRQKAFDEYHAERDRKHEEYKARIEANIEKLEARKSRLLEIIARKEDHLDDLQNQLNDAWSDDFRDRVSGWISDEEAKLSELHSQLNDVDNWIEESRNKLNH